MEKVIKLYALDRDNNIVPFPSSTNQVEVGNFRYNSARMGGAPTLTATVMWSTCLDDEWNDETRFIKSSVFAIFNEEKYFLRQTPTSSYSNEEARYKHELSLISERMTLDNVYFYDVVSSIYDGKPVSNSTKVVFSGNIQEFVQRLNASLVFTGVQEVDSNNNYVSGYRAVIDDGITSEDKLLSFEDSFFSNVLQEIYNQYELPYYFDGKTIHIGYSGDVIAEPFAQGVNNALLSITKQNANNKVVNRITGVGSADNIPFYYPNKSPKGDLITECSNTSLNVEIIAPDLYSSKIGLDKAIEYKYVPPKTINKTLIDRTESIMHATSVQQPYSIEYDIEEESNYRFSLKLLVSGYMAEESPYWTIESAYVEFYKDDTLLERREWEGYLREDLEQEFDIHLDRGTYTIKTYYMLSGVSLLGYLQEVLTLVGGVEYDAWTYEDKEVKPKKIGLKITGTPQNGDTITQRMTKRITTSGTLMPSIYRGTDGKQRFYNAVNGGYTIDGYTVDFGDITFNNPWIEGKPSEHSIKFDDIKPTIKEATYLGQRIDMFLDVAYDELPEKDDNETYEDDGGNTNYKHPYFFVKLHKLGFNLFDHAIEQQSMVVSMTSGDCGSCEFEIAVDEQEDGTFVNTVQVDENGNLVRDENGRVLCGVEDFQPTLTEFQDSQQDTTNNEVWIALRKEDSTYGILMPHAPKEEDGVPIEAEHRIKPNEDTFVLLGINLPESYILDAEKRLEDKLFEYLKDNNDEKFNFSIAFSRIFFEENPTVLQHLNENSCVSVVYNGKTYDSLYVSSFSYSMSQSEVLPQITVELKDSLSVSQNAILNAINEVKGDIINKVNNIDILARIAPYVLRKDVDDVARGTIDFKKGVKFGEGGKVEILDNNSAKLTIEYLEVTKKATFTALEIQERTHVGGQLLVTPAAMNCGEVEELSDRYRCYFQTKGENGDEIYNQFAVGDQAICQTYNVWGSKYYWRLVIEVGKDYIDLSKSDCDESSDNPAEGDKIIQLGNRNDESRQNAIILASHGDGSPYFVQYKGINNYDLPKEDNDQRLVTKFSPDGNLITGKVKMVAGSEGLEQFTEWAEKQTAITNAMNTADSAYSNAQTANSLLDDISNDNKLTGEEKRKLKIEFDSILKEYSKNVTLADTYSLASSFYTTAYNNLNSVVNPLLTNLNTTSDCNGENIRNLFSNYYEQRVILLNAITEKAKNLADAAKSAADEADRNAEQATEALSTFINDDYSIALEDIHQQIDGKSETFVQTINPASNWATAEERQTHIGDIWWNTSNNEVANVPSGATAVYSSSFTWEVTPVPKSIFDLIDGKADIFTTKPTKYEKNDLWIVENNTVIAGYKEGDLLVALNSRDSYLESDWTKKVRYTDDTKANAAQQTADDVQEELDNLQVGGNNLLRNTGFTGDFLSEQLADQKVLDTTTEMFSPWYDHWTCDHTKITPIALTGISASGKGVQFSSSTNAISQELSPAFTPNTSYIVSFKAKSTNSSNKQVAINVGGQSKTITVTPTWNRYVIQMTSGSSNGFSLTSSYIQLCELQLELGNKATSWKPNPLDNGSDRAYWQSMKYLQQSVQDASTTFIGGLGLTQTIMVGNYDRESKEMTEVTGGVSGVYNNANDIVFWGGGTYQQATQTAQDYLSHGDAWQPTQEQIAQMAQFVVTHGGKAILNNVIARGVIFATNGVFNGTVYANNGSFTGEIQAISGSFNGDVKANIMRLKLSTPNTGQPIDGSFIDLDNSSDFGTTYILPQLSYKEVMSIDAASSYPRTKLAYFSQVTNGNNNEVKIRVYDTSLSKFVYVTEFEFLAESIYRLIGIGKKQSETVWTIYETMKG